MIGAIIAAAIASKVVIDRVVKPGHVQAARRPLWKRVLKAIKSKL